MDPTRKPLIPKNDSDAPPQPTPYAIGLVNTLGYLRAIAGFTCIVAPTFTGKIFQLPIAAASTESVLLRLFGVRDTVIGELTWFVRPKAARGESAAVPRNESERRELRRVLWANVATDSLDVACVAFALGKGVLSKPAAACVGGGATAFLVLGLLALREI